MNETLFPFIASVIALVFVLYLSMGVLKMDMGNEKMKEISRAVQGGARAFLKREYSYVLVFIAIIALFIGFSPSLFEGTSLSWSTSIAFVIGAIASASAGYIGMSIATRSNSRTTHAASEDGVKAALSVAVSGGAVMGFSVVGLALLGLTIVYTLFNGKADIVNGYAMGASLMALFARSGGGIFTKGADMGADLVGKIEAGIPEDDPRNPGVIADNVGDNVGDVAGLGADLLESYVESIIASLAIAGTVGVGLSLTQAEVAQSLRMLPLTIASVGIIASIIGVFYVKVFSRKNPQSALMGGTYVSAILTIIATYAIVKRFGVPFSFGNPGTVYSAMGPFYATITGVLSGMIVGFISEYFTSAKYSPVKKLAERSQAGPALTVTEGMAVGMDSTAIPVIILAIAVIVAHHYAGIYGVAMAALGMLATTGMIVSVDSYGPIADNAGGIAEMAGLDPSVRDITDNLDAVGNTTAAIGKGFAIGSAAFATMGLLAAYMAAAHVDTADLRRPMVLAGLLIGGMLPYVFASQLFRAVSKCADGVISEVRRQFKDDPGTDGRKGDARFEHLC